MRYASGPGKQFKQLATLSAARHDGTYVYDTGDPGLHVVDPGLIWCCPFRAPSAPSASSRIYVDSHELQRNELKRMAW